MPTADSILASTDAFAALGVERRFDLDASMLGQARDRRATEASLAGDPAVAAKAGEKLAEAYATLADPVSRGLLLADLMGGASDGKTNGVPPGFRERFDVIRHSPTHAEGLRERERLLAQAAHLFKLLGSADNGVVLRERRRQIRETLNAVRLLDPTAAATEPKS